MGLKPGDLLHVGVLLAEHLLLDVTDLGILALLHFVLERALHFVLMEQAVDEDLAGLLQEADHVLVDDGLAVRADGSLVDDEALKELQILEVIVVGLVVVVLELLLEAGVLLGKEVLAVSLSKDEQKVISINYVRATPFHFPSISAGISASSSCLARACTPC